MNISKHIRQLSLSLIAFLVVGLAFTSCGTIFDYEGDCSYTYHIKFRYTNNILNAEAFAGNITHVSLYVFDVNTGKLVLDTTESDVAVLSAMDYTMELPLSAGTYDVVAWCGDAVANNKVVIPELQRGVSTLEDLSCAIDRVTNSEHSSCVFDHMGHLYHGKERVTFTEEPGRQVCSVNLTKNSNSIKVVLQSIQKGQYLSRDDFDFRIQDHNGNMNYDNTLAACEQMTYHAWAISEISADVDAEVDDDVHKKIPTRAADSTSTAVMAELTIGRLMVENEPKLVVYNKTSEALVLSIPLKDYALMVKGYGYSHWSDQEYLDRQDNFTMTFFLDELGTWIASYVIINDWKIVLQNTEL
ncbi:MAG: FimB/Mfa2 family fimbrial subunit [Paludibacteraceae bacterium]|jgi:hypothetical protein|nr:FimB/Mfa2 family fimbrial subunit [Paludibacteraceae bacterium]